MILMNDFTAEPHELQEAMLTAVRRVLESGRYILGDEVLAFERHWASACGVRYGIGVGSGTDAIEISLRALEIGPGDEVVTSAMTAFATVLGIVRAGATPVLADIDPATALLSRASVERCLSSSTKAVLLVHLYGQMRTMDAWLALCKSHRVLLVEDCAQAHLSAWRGKGAGSFGAAGAYSFYPTKNLGAAGDAGMVVTDDKVLAQHAIRLRDYGQRVRFHHDEPGLNSRLDELHAAMLGERMKWLPQFTARRRQIAEAYRSGIRNTLVQLLEPPEESAAHVYHLFVITSPKRDALQTHLEKQGVLTLVHYPLPIHHQKPCRDLARDPQGLSCSERHASRCLSLPCHPQMSDNDVNKVIEAINGFR